MAVDKLVLGAIDFVGPAAEFARFNASLHHAMTLADKTELRRVRVIITDRAVDPDLVDDVIAALNRRTR